MIALLHFQQALNEGLSIDPHQLNEDYLVMYDEPNGGKRHSYAKIINGEVQALAIFGLEEPINGIVCYNVGYAVHMNHRGRGLAVEAVNIGLDKLRNELSLAGVKSFYLEAVIDVVNSHSILVAKKLFSKNGILINERDTGTLSLHFKKLIIIQ